VLAPRAVLALTATATPVTRACIRQLLAIPPEQQLIESPLRSNLRLQVAHHNGASKGGGIAAKVVQLLTTGEPHALCAPAAAIKPGIIASQLRQHAANAAHFMTAWVIT
jgi:superfamily II DNA helicase RecQ